MINPNFYKDLYNLLTEEQQKEFKRTAAGVSSQVIREGLELYRMLDKPTASEVQTTEKFLEDLYSGVVGKENVAKAQRGDRTVTVIAEPETTAGRFTRDIGSFSASLLGVGKITAPLKGLKALQTASKVAPKTTKAAALLGKTEVATQLSLNPYEENLGNFLGSMIDDSNEGLLGDFEEYLLDPIKSSQEKTELENRLALLAEGIAITGVLGAGMIGAKALYNNSEQIKKPFINALKTIRNKGPEAAKDFINKIKINSNSSPKRDLLKDVKEKSTTMRQKMIRSGSERDLGDIQGLDDKFILIPFTNIGLSKFSYNPAVRTLANVLANTFTSRGSQTKKMFETTMNFKGVQAKFDKTIENTLSNLNNSLEIIYKSTKDTKEETLDKLSELLFTDFRVPGIITSRGTKAPITQRAEFLKKLEQFPKEARQAIIDARDYQDKLSKLLLDSKYITDKDKKNIVDQLGIYARRSYKQFEDPLYVPSAEVVNTAREFIRAEILKKKPNIKESDLEQQLYNEMDNLVQGKGSYAKLIKSEGQFGRVNNKILQDRLKVPKAIRDYYGEISNPVERLAISMNKISKLVTNLNFYNTLYKDGKGIYFYKNPKQAAGFNVKIPTGKDFKSQKGYTKSVIPAFGDLSGMYTHPIIAKLFTEFTKNGKVLPSESQLGQIGQGIWKTLLTLKGTSQRFKTVWNQGTHFQNIYGGAHGTVAQGIFPSLESFQRAVKDLSADFRGKTDLEQQKYMEKLSGYNILNKGPVARELNALMKDYEDIKGPFDFILKKEYQTKVLQSINKKARQVGNTVTDLYIAEDDFFKILMYEQELKYLKKFNAALPDNYNGFYRFTSEEALEREAARRVIGGLPNYDIVPPNFLRLRRQPFFGNFFSFLVESTRIGFSTPIQATKEIVEGSKLIKQNAKEAGEILRNRGIKRLAASMTIGAGGELLKMGTKYAIPGGGAYLGYQGINKYINGVDEQTEKDLKAVGAPPYLNLDNVIINIAEDGTPIMHNISRYDFYDFPKKLIRFIPDMIEETTLTEGDVEKLFYDYANDMLSPIFGQSIVTSTLTSYMLGRGREADGSLMRNPYENLFGGRGLRYNPDAGFLDGDNLTVLLANMLDDLTPGAATSVRKYLNNYGKDETDFDQDIHQGKEILKLLTGYGSTPLNKKYLENVYGLKANDFNTKLRKKQSELIRYAYTANSPKQFENNFKKVQKDYYENYKDFYVVSRAASRLGLRPLGLLDNLSTLTRRAIGVSSNTFVPLNLSPGLLDALKENDNISASEYLKLYKILIKERQALSQLPILEYQENFVNEDNKKEEREKKVEGGLIEGEYEVPNTKENPADRINPYTGEPYEGLLLEDLPFFNLDIRQTFNEGGLSEEERERLTLQAQELMKLDPPLQQTAPVIELLVAGVPRIIYGVGKTGFNLINTLAKESVKKPKPVNYYHGSNLKLKEVTPMGDRATSPDVKDLFQQASYIAKPGDRGLELANFYARGGGFVNVIGKKQFDEVVKKLYNPRNISDELKDKVTKQISMRQAFINKAKTEKVNRNKLGRARREIVDLENLIKPFGSGYISRITPVQRKFLEREGFDGVDVSDDVVAIFRKVPVKSSIRGSLTQRLINRRNARQSKINE